MNCMIMNLNTAFVEYKQYRTRLLKIFSAQAQDIYSIIPLYIHYVMSQPQNTRVGTLIVATIYLQMIQNRYMFRSFTVLHCNHQHCVQPVASDVEVVGYL